MSSSYKVVMLPVMGEVSGYVDRSGGGKMCHRRTTKWSLETKIIEKAPKVALIQNQLDHMTVTSRYTTVT